MKKFLSLVGLSLLFTSLGWCAMQSSVSQFGITWTFDKEYEAGQFANGDWWVVGPAVITTIDPAPSGGRNGFMINPQPGDAQAYDNRADGYTQSLLPQLNTTIPVHSSIVSTISNPEAQDCSRGWTNYRGSCHSNTIKTAAVLTVLETPAPEGSFRPPFCGSDKAVTFNKSALDYSLLARLAPVARTPELSTVERYFERPWVNHRPGWVGSTLVPNENMEGYGRETSADVSVGALMLHLDYSNAEKEKLLVSYVQVGIDLYGAVENGMYWPPDGGHASGRKWPILFAGLMLNDEEMKAIGTTDRFAGDCGEHPCFGEDAQTFYVGYTDPAEANDDCSYPNPSGHEDVNHGCGGYTDADIGLPDWGIRHYEQSRNCQNDNREWNSSYQGAHTVDNWGGFILAARIMEEKAQAKTLWNHDALFDYMDRYADVEGVSLSSFTKVMWTVYRKNYGCTWKRNNPSDTYSLGALDCGACIYGCTSTAAPDKGNRATDLGLPSRPRLRVWENPAPRRMVLQWNADTQAAGNINIIEPSGRVVRSINADHGNTVLEINDLSPGVYFLRWEDGTVLRFVKSN